MWASDRGAATSVKLLLKAGADKDAKDNVSEIEMESEDHTHNGVLCSRFELFFFLHFSLTSSPSLSAQVAYALSVSFSAS